MGLDFDIAAGPPDAGKIAAARSALAEERQRLRGLNKRFLIVIGGVVLTLVCLLLLVAIPEASKPETEGGILFVFVYAMPYFFFTTFVVGNTMHHSKVEVPRKAMELAEAALQDAEPEAVAELSDVCQTYAPLGAYRASVAALERPLFKGEIEAMRIWLEVQAAMPQSE